MTSTALSQIAGGRYRVERVLGRGGMATVYLARDTELGREVALKVLDGRFEGDEEMVRRFRREARTAAGLQHPNVVGVFDAGDEDGRLYIVMECVSGEGLDAVLDREGALPPAAVRRIAGEAAAGLGYAHAGGVVHRDVKPANLLLRQEDGTVKVTDFGIARAAADAATQLTQAGTILGTAAYLAPEQARGEVADARADVFALGVVVYEALTGRVPWPVEGIASLAELGRTPAPPPSALAKGVPASLDAAVGRALAFDPADRPADGDAFRRELEGEADGATRATVALPHSRETASTAPTALLDRAPRRHRGALRRAPFVAAGLVVAALLAALVVALASGGDDRSNAGANRPARAQVQPVPSSADAQDQASALEEWIREHTAGG